MSASKETQPPPGSDFPSSTTYSYQGEQPPPYSAVPPMYNPPKTPTPSTHQYESFCDINPEAPSSTTPLVSSSSFDDQTVRKGFVRKVFGIVAVQLVFTFTVVCVFTFSTAVKEGVQAHLWAYLSSFFVYLVIIIALSCCCKSFSRRHPWNLVALFVVTISFSFMMGTIASYHNTTAVIITMGVTLAISVAIMAFSVQNRYNFNICNSLSLVAVVTIGMFGIFCSFYYTHIAEVIYGCLGALLFSVYLSIDCQLMMGIMSYRVDPEDYVNAALRIYLDIALIFLFLLGRG